MSIIKNKICSLTICLTVGSTWAMEAPQPDYFSATALTTVEAHYGAQASTRIKAWQQLIARGQQFDSHSEKLVLANHFINQVNFVSDIEHWQQEDYWATPVELIASNGGDCEDYAVAKLTTLKLMGIPGDQLRLMYVKDLRSNQPHMVLTYHPQQGDMPLVLDNIDPQIRPASDRADLQPIISFNGDRHWLARVQGHGDNIHEQGGAFWQTLMDRIQNRI